MKLQTHHIFYLFVCALFLAISGSALFSEGMFMDGLLYADLSRNMAEDLGTFWRPHLTNTFFPEFYEHPPLALGLQGLWFWLFGDSIYVERFYALFTYALVGVLLVMIWTKLTGDHKTGWLPLLLWLVVPDVTWAVANNMLENTMSVFVCLAVFLYLKSVDKDRFLWVVFAGFALSMGLLSKGFFCLYIWGLPFFHWLFMRPTTFGKMAINTGLIVLSTCVPIALLLVFSVDAHHNMMSYFNKQVLGSIENVQTVETRFTIIFKLLQNIVVPVGLVLVVVLVGFRKKVKEVKLSQNVKIAMLFMALVLSGVLPIMISMKQRGFYILTVYPLFAIGLAYLVYPILKPALAKLTGQATGFGWFRIVTAALCVLAIFIGVRQLGAIGRNKEMIEDTKVIIQQVGVSSTVGICPSLYTNWDLHGYFSRYGNVSLDKSPKQQYTYFIGSGACTKYDLHEQYEKMEIPTRKYQLYRLKK